MRPFLFVSFLVCFMRASAAGSTTAAGYDVEIIAGQWVPSFTDNLSGINGVGAVAPKDVNGLSDRLQMVRITACPILANGVIEHHAIRYILPGVDICVSVNPPLFASNSSNAISGVVNGWVNPASSIGYLAPGANLLNCGYWFLLYHLVGKDTIPLRMQLKKPKE